MFNTITTKVVKILTSKRTITRYWALDFLGYAALIGTVVLISIYSENFAYFFRDIALAIKHLIQRGPW